MITIRDEGGIQGISGKVVEGSGRWGMMLRSIVTDE